MAKKPNLEETVRGLLSSQHLAVLATHNKGQPHCSLVAFAATDDIKHLAFATSRATRKYANITTDSRVALLMDNRSNEDADFHKAVAVTAIGMAQEVTQAERDELLTLYLQRHPHLKEFVCSPTCALLRVDVEKYSVVSRFQDVMELRIVQ